MLIIKENLEVKQVLLLFLVSMSGTDKALLDDAILKLATQTPLPLSTDSLETRASSRISDTFLVETEDDTYGDDRRANESSLPPVDGGFNAWSFVR